MDWMFASHPSLYAEAWISRVAVFEDVNSKEVIKVKS